MARLGSDYDLGVAKIAGEDFGKFLGRQGDALGKLEAEGKVLKFPVADGYAHYYVKSLKPAVLQYIPFCDNYKADPALIRGLNAKDIGQRIEQAKRFAALFSR